MSTGGRNGCNIESLLTIDGRSCSCRDVKHRISDCHSGGAASGNDSPVMSDLAKYICNESQERRLHSRRLGCSLCQDSWNDHTVRD